VDLFMNSGCAPATARSFEVNITEGDRPLVSRVPQESLSIRAGYVVLAIIASCGFAWIVISSVTWPPDLAWVGEVERMFGPAGGSSSLSQQIIYSSASIADSAGGLADARTVPEAGTAAGLGDGLEQHHWRAGSRAKSSAGATPPSPSTIARSPALEQRKASRLSANDLDSRAKRTPIAETRPTTVEGWTIREVTNGIAVLEGPNGVWRVRRGDTVPGVGKIDSILLWGERWIVATSQGLISTP
jgi:hypothetical protein